MPKDTQEALRRLEAELLAEDNEPEREAEAPVAQRRKYRAYNTDRSDRELEAYSEEVRRGDRGIAGLITVLWILIGLILCVVLLILLRFWGVL